MNSSLEKIMKLYKLSYLEFIMKTMLIISKGNNSSKCGDKKDSSKKKSFTLEKRLMCGNKTKIGEKPKSSIFFKGKMDVSMEF